MSASPGGGVSPVVLLQRRGQLFCFRLQNCLSIEQCDVCAEKCHKIQKDCCRPSFWAANWTAASPPQENLQTCKQTFRGVPFGATTAPLLHHGLAVRGGARKGRLAICHISDAAAFSQWGAARSERVPATSALQGRAFLARPPSLSPVHSPLPSPPLKAYHDCWSARTRANASLPGTGDSVVIAVFCPSGFSAGTRTTRKPMCMLASA